MNHLHFAAIERSFLAILAGFATMAVLVTVATSAISRSFPRLIGEPAQPRRRYTLLNLTYSAAFAAAGGYVTAIVAKADPLRNVFMLAIVILLISGLSALQMRGKQPLAYQFALIVVTPVAALAGGLLRMHEAGYRW
jgi:MFS-type transporter involved in bile tolerance (Atg22 family)